MIINWSFIDNYWNIFLSVFWVILFFLFIALFVLIIIAIIKLNKLRDNYKEIQEEIRYSVAPKSIQLSMGVNELVDLAVEIWRIEQRIMKSTSNLQEQQLKGLNNSIQKLRRYLSNYDIEILDYKNQKYNEGLSLDILSVEKDTSLSEPVIKETVEPTILCKGQVVRKAKIILIKNN